MSTLSTVIVFSAILLPAGLYVWLALKERKNVKSIRDFFPLTRFMDGETFGRSTAAAGVSLATVILALVNLAPLLGISLLITISSYALSFVVLYFCASTILRANPDNDTVQTFLGKTYGTPIVRNIALTFSFIGYISIFSMELLVGVTVLEPFLGERVLIFSFVYLLFIIAYSLISGFRAIVATEQWQIRFIIASVLVLVVFLPLLWANGAKSVSFSEVTRNVFSSWNATWAFCLGILAINLPAPISDSATWQRLCSTKSEKDAKRGLLLSIGMFLLIWGTLIIFGCYIAQVAAATGQFDGQKSTLMTFIVSSLATSGWLHLSLLFVFILGLFAAMITTADNLLLVSTQLFSLDLLHLHENKAPDRSNIRKARIVLAIIASVSFLIFVLFRLIQFDVVQLIFATYGAQLALFPAVAAALFFKNKLDYRKAWFAAAASIFCGFTAAWASAFYGKFSGNASWLYNAPVIALVGSAVIFFILALFARQTTTVNGVGSRQHK